jgi:hypothetical protein
MSSQDRGWDLWRLGPFEGGGDSDRFARIGYRANETTGSEDLLN